MLRQSGRCQKISMVWLTSENPCLVATRRHASTRGHHFDGGTGSCGTPMVVMVLRASADRLHRCLRAVCPLSPWRMPSTAACGRRWSDAPRRAAAQFVVQFLGRTSRRAFHSVEMAARWRVEHTGCTHTPSPACDDGVEQQCARGGVKQVGTALGLDAPGITRRLEIFRCWLTNG